jgi:hypothetical protein
MTAKRIPKRIEAWAILSDDDDGPWEWAMCASRKEAEEDLQDYRQGEETGDRIVHLIEAPKRKRGKG